MKKKLVFFTALLFANNIFAQTTDTVTVNTDTAAVIKKQKKVNLFIVPALASNPTAGFMYGIAGVASTRLGPVETTQISDAMLAIIYTTKNQSINLFKTNVFLKNDSWNLKGDWRLFLSSQPTYGLGTGPQSAKPVGTTGIEYAPGLYGNAIKGEQMMSFNLIRFHDNALRRIGDTRFFTGLGYQLDYYFKIEDNLLDTTLLTPTITSHYAYSIEEGFNPNHNTLSGITVNALYDSRDNTVFPVHGQYAYASWRLNPEFTGSDKNSSILWLEYRNYFNLSKTRPRHLIGLWTYASMVTSGKVPYMDLPALGWDQFGKSGRGYGQGRFRGKQIIYGELEYRVPLPAIIKKYPDLLGAVVFVNGTTANNTAANINLFTYVEPGYGLGLRIMTSTKTKANITLDYAWGKYGSRGFYFNFNETF